jgi:hypothetical protein
VDLQAFPRLVEIDRYLSLVQEFALAVPELQPDAE